MVVAQLLFALSSKAELPTAALQEAALEGAVPQQACRMRTALTGVLVVGLAVPTAQAGSAVTWQDILADQRTIGDVVSYGLGPQGQGYSPLDRIDRVNVAALVAA
jgi:glucose dehydrogenase